MAKLDEGLVACQAACNQKDDEVNQLLAKSECLVTQLAATELKRKDLQLPLAKPQSKELGGSVPHVIPTKAIRGPSLWERLCPTGKRSFTPEIPYTHGTRNCQRRTWTRKSR